MSIIVKTKNKKKGFEKLFIVKYFIMSHMSIWKPSDAEKENILNQHQTLYDGYAALNKAQSNMTPLTVQDFAKDKGGMVMNNNGKVMTYTNVGIHESVEESMCEQCGGAMNEGECSECGYVNEQMYGQRLDVSQDLDPKAGFDYIQGSSNDVDTYEGMHKKLYKEQYDQESSAYNFDTDGPEEFKSKSDFDTINQEYELQQDELDYESQHDTDSDAREMIARMVKMMNREYDGQEKMGGEDSAYHFVSDGPGAGESYGDTDDLGMYEEEALDESAVENHNVIMEMFKRMSKF